MQPTGLPFDDIRALCRMLPPPDAAAMAAVRERDATLAKTPGALGRLEDIPVWLAGWQGLGRPTVMRPLLAVFAGNHGVAARGVSAWPQSATAEQVALLAAGGGAVNQICAVNDIGLKVFELALPHPTADFAAEPAMAERDCAATIAFGMEAIAGGADLLCLGHIGVGGEVSAAALLCALRGGAPEDWLTERDGAVAENAAAAVRAGLALHAPALGDPLEALRRLGGRECAAMVGAILAARLQRIPVVLDGVVSLAAGAVLKALEGAALDHCMIAQASPAAAGLTPQAPLLALGVTGGDGSGAALAAGLIRIAAACHNDMATREEAGMSGKLN